MAYCRFSDTCDVYMYQTFNGYMFHLSRDVKSGTSDFLIKDSKEALRKLIRLQTQGFGVPDYAISRLKEEVEQ